MPHINCVFRGLVANSNMADAAGNYTRSTTSLTIEELAGALAGDAGRRHFERYHDHNRSLKRDLFVEIAPKILAQLIDHDDPLSITICFDDQEITLAEESERLVLSDEVADITYIIPGKTHEIIKRQLAEEISSNRDLYGDHTADWAALILYDISSAERTDNGNNTERIIEPFGMLGIPSELWCMVGKNLDLHSLLSLGTVSKQFDAAFHDAKHQAILTSIINRMNCWSGVGERLLASLLRLSSEYRRIPLEHMLSSLSHLSLPELRLASKTLSDAAPSLSKTEQQLALRSLAMTTVPSIRLLPASERTMTFKMVQSTASALCAADRLELLAVLVPIISDLPGMERYDVFESFISEAGELDRSSQAKVLTPLFTSLGCLPEATRSAAFASALAAVERLETGERLEILPALARQIACLAPRDREQALMATLAQIRNADQALQGEVLTILARLTADFPDDGKRIPFESMLASVDELAVNHRRQPLHALCAGVFSLPPAYLCDAIKGLIHAIGPLDTASQATVLAAFAKNLARIPKVDRPKAFDYLLAATGPLEAEQKALVVTALARVIDNLPEPDRSRAFANSLETARQLAQANRIEALLSLGRRVADLLPTGRTDAFHRVLEAVHGIDAAEDRALPLQTLIEVVFSLPRHHIEAAFDLLAAAAARLPAEAACTMKSIIRQRKSLCALL